MNKKSPHRYFASLLEIGQTVLNKSQDDIIKVFKSSEMCLTEYRYGEIKNNVLELQFEEATLTCLLNDSSLCNLSILYLDSMNDIVHYIRWCDDSYEYSYEQNIWQTDNGYIRLKHGKDTGKRIAFIQCVNQEYILKDQFR